MRTTERMITRELSGPRKIETRLFAGLVAFGKSVLRALRNRVAMNRLNELEDYQLNDIGLTRLDVEMAVNRSKLHEDPFALLPLKARQRGRRFAASSRRL
jgi:uncharacterized protein YjiS (DUF1127 family)